jgi:hypothetical protein
VRLRVVEVWVPNATHDRDPVVEIADAALDLFGTEFLDDERLRQESIGPLDGSKEVKGVVLIEGSDCRANGESLGVV